MVGRHRSRLLNVNRQRLGDAKSESACDSTERAAIHTMKAEWPDCDVSRYGSPMMWKSRAEETF